MFFSTTNGCLQLYFLFCNLVTAAALFYLAELVEEYTVVTAKVIKGMLAVSNLAFGLVICVATVGRYCRCAKRKLPAYCSLLQNLN